MGIFTYIKFILVTANVFMTSATFNVDSKKWPNKYFNEYLFKFSYANLALNVAFNSNNNILQKCRLFRLNKK